MNTQLPTHKSRNDLKKTQKVKNNNEIITN